MQGTPDTNNGHYPCMRCGWPPSCVLPVVQSLYYSYHVLTLWSCQVGLQTCDRLPQLLSLIKMRMLPCGSGSRANVTPHNGLDERDGDPKTQSRRNARRPFGGAARTGDCPGRWIASVSMGESAGWMAERAAQAGQAANSQRVEICTQHIYMWYLKWRTWLYTM